jgi:hypothetical protein
MPGFVAWIYFNSVPIFLDVWSLNYPLGQLAMSSIIHLGPIKNVNSNIKFQENLGPGSFGAFMYNLPYQPPPLVKVALADFMPSGADLLHCVGDLGGSRWP